MAKDKDRALNPAAAHRKQEKQKALKKGKAAVAASRTARLATRNPSRLERQITDLKTLESSSGSLNPRDTKQLKELEAELGRVTKARSERPDLVPQHAGRGGREGGGRGERGGGVLGKRRREGRSAGDSEGSGSDTEEDVRRIPMPRDTPPPMPRPRHHHTPRHSTNANSEPLGAGRESLANRGAGEGEKPDLSLPAKPASTGKTVYEAKPQVRDLKKEATRFMPNVVKAKIEAARGKGRLLEEAEVEGSERSGYIRGGNEGGGGNGLEGGGGDERKRLLEEEERWAREMAEVQVDGESDGGGHGKKVTMEEVEDEDLYF